MRIFKLHGYVGAKTRYWEGDAVRTRHWTRKTRFHRGVVFVELGYVRYNGSDLVCIVSLGDISRKSSRWAVRKPAYLITKSAWLRFRQISTLIWDYDRNTDKEHRLSLTRLDKADANI